MGRISRAFFNRPSDKVARDLLGVVLLVDGVGGAIVETESYDGDDPASHSYPMRPTERNAVMFGPPGYAYVYRSYGIHWCLNFVCEVSSAVLIRAIAPEYRIDVMRKRRGMVEPERLCAGPGRLCQALDITGALNGASLFAHPFALKTGGEIADIHAGPRIGISKAKDAHRRFGVKGSAFLSKRF
jgi:DNA-3-methyladenine glycosylase